MREFINLHMITYHSSGKENIKKGGLQRRVILWFVELTKIKSWWTGKVGSMESMSHRTHIYDVTDEGAGYN